MAETIWNLVSPVGVRSARSAPKKQLGRSTKRVLGFLSNRKPNTSAVERGLAALLASRQLEVRFYEKANSAVGAGEELLDRIGADCGLVVNGTGD